MKRLFQRLLPLFIVLLFLSGCGSAPSSDNEQLSSVSSEQTSVQPDSITQDVEALPDTNSSILDTPNTNSAPSPTQSLSAEPSPTPVASVTPDSNSTPSVTIPENSTFSIHFIDVGQADAALVECDGEFMLIDGGNKADSSIIYSVLKKAGASHLKLVVGTHAHEDHIGGIPGAFNYASADVTLCPVTSYDSEAFRDFSKYAAQKGGGIQIPAVGDLYTVGSATVTILGVNGGSDTNDTSIVLAIQYGENSFLFTGDAEREAEQAILNSSVDLSSTVLKVGHHGSDTSTSYPFLREIMPKYAVISVGTGNSYGHPTESTLSRLRDADVITYRTDLQGDIICTSDGKNVTFSVEKNSGANTLAPATTPTPTPEADDNQEQAGMDYVLNTNSKKFHYPNCGNVEKMSEKNKAYFTGTREEIISRGYSSCGNCNP